MYGSGLGLAAGTVPIYSNDLLRAVIDPGSDNTPQDVASPSTSTNVYDRVEYQYNTQGQQVEVKDQNTTIHDYIFDLLGRETEDEVRQLGTGIDSGISSPVLRIQQGYDLLGNVVHITSYSSATVGKGTVLNEVFRQYDDWGDLTAEYQNTTEAATDGNGNVINETPYAGYVYDDGVVATGLTPGLPTPSTVPSPVPYLRESEMIYPNGRILHYVYNTGIDADMGRVERLGGRQWQRHPGPNPRIVHLPRHRPDCRRELSGTGRLDRRDARPIRASCEFDRHRRKHAGGLELRL